MSSSNDVKKKIYFSPATPIPLKFDVPKRIAELKTFLDPTHPDYEPEMQHVNIRGAIKLYEDGTLNGQHVHIMDGKLATLKEVSASPAPSWTEGMLYQRAQKYAYGHGDFGPNGHELKMLLRLTPERGGDGTSMGITSLHDTGSDALLIFDTDLLQLGANVDGYLRQHGYTDMVSANGTVDRCRQIQVQIQLVRDDDTPWSDWVDEDAIIRPAQPGLTRLSGAGMRDVFYFGMAPGNDYVAVSATKGGMASLI